MSTVSLTLDEIFELAKKTLLANGCDDETASILSDLIRNAERDGSVSHGLFRLPAGNLNKPCDTEPSLSAFLIRSDKIDAVSSSQPFAKSVFLASSNISSKVKDTVLIILIYIFYINQKILNYICCISFQSHLKN